MTIIEDTTAAVVEPQEPAPKKKAAKKSQAVAVAAPPAAPPSGSLAVLQQAMANGATGDDLKNLLDVYERLEAREARKAFDVAMALAQAEMPVIVKNRLVDYENKKKDDSGKTTRTTYKHEDLAQVVETIKPVLHKHGLAHRFRTEHVGDQIKVTCIITGHGWREETSLQSSRDTSGGKNDVQGIASAVTYLERYTLKAALGLAAAHDDDGRGSEGEPTTITALQLQELEKLITEVGANADKACKALKINSLAELPADLFDRAKAKLETMRVPL